MLSRLMAPALNNIPAIDVTNFVTSIIDGEYAIRKAIIKLKIESIHELYLGLG